MSRRHVIFLAALLVWPAAGADLTSAARTELFSRNIGDHMFARYQHGFVSLINDGLASFCVDSAAGEEVLNQPLVLPDSYRVVINDVAIAVDGRIAVAASAMDKEARQTSVIAWLASDGSLNKVVRTAPFGVAHIAFTGDGTLWALGRLKEPSLRSDVPVHDILRQYDGNGKLIRSVVSRLSFSSQRHPASRAVLVASRDQVALVSDTANQWTIVGTDGLVVAEGSFALPDTARMMSAALTDSGRLFLGVWLRGEQPSFLVYEARAGSGELTSVETSPLAPSGETTAWLIGADRDQLVFQATAIATRETKLVWSTPGPKT